MSGGYSSFQCAVLTLQWLLLLRSTGSRPVGFSSCSTRAQHLWLGGSRAQAQQLWRMGLAAPRHVGSSQTTTQNCVPCIGRWILNHCATREAPLIQLLCIRENKAIFCSHTQRWSSKMSTNYHQPRGPTIRNSVDTMELFSGIHIS